MATYIGFSTNSRFTNFQVTDFDLVVEDLLNHFSIRVGEKLMNPTFGCIVWDMLFENYTQEVRTAIIDNITAIIDSEPRVNLTGITVDEYEQGIQIGLNLQYIPSGDARALALSFDRDSQQIYVG